MNSFLYSCSLCLLALSIPLCGIRLEAHHILSLFLGAGVQQSLQSSEKGTQEVCIAGGEVFWSVATSFLRNDQNILRNLTWSQDKA